VTEQRHGVYVISDDPALLDLEVIYRYLSEESYWAAGRTRQTVEESVAASLNFGAYTSDGTMVGAARIVGDGSTFAWLCDVFVVDAHRGQGLGETLVETAITHPSVADVKRVILATGDAHKLYARYGFESMAPEADKWMIRMGTTA